VPNTPDDVEDRRGPAGMGEPIRVAAKARAVQVPITMLA